MSDFIGKGSNRRPRGITKEEESLRWAYAFGKMSFDEFERRYNKLLKQGKIRRNGRVING